jgi:hypothetical protein
MLSIAKTEPQNGMAYHFSPISWAIFGVLTWDHVGRTRCNDFSEEKRVADFNGLIHFTSSKLRLRPRNLGIYHKTEWGVYLRGHYHVLIARQGTEKVSPELLAETLKAFWCRYGYAKIEPFDPKRQCEGVAYQTKSEFDSQGHERPNFERTSTRCCEKMSE